MTREQLVKGTGDGGVEGWGHLTRTVSDQMPCCDVNSSAFLCFFFFKLKHCLDEIMRTTAHTVSSKQCVLVHESFMSDGLYHMQKDKRDLFHFNHL